MELEASLHEQVAALADQVAALAVPVESAKSLAKIAPAVYTLVAGAIAFGIWLGTLEWRVHSGDSRHSDLVRRDTAHDTALEAINLWRERTDAQRFTAAEAATTVATLKDTLSSLDKRQQRTEDAMDNVKATLERIESRLLPGGTNKP